MNTMHVNYFKIAWKYRLATFKIRLQLGAEFLAVTIQPSVYVLIITKCGPPLWSSGQSFWLQIQRSRVRFPALPDFLSSSGSGTGSTHPREIN